MVNIGSITKLGAIVLAISWARSGAATQHPIKPPTDEQAEEYKLDTAFYKKCALVQDILIATSARVSDHAILEVKAELREYDPTIYEIIERVYHVSDDK